MKPDGDGFFVLVTDSQHHDAQIALKRSTKWATYMRNVDSLISPYHQSNDSVAQAKQNLDGLFDFYHVEHHPNTRLYKYCDFKGITLLRILFLDRDLKSFLQIFWFRLIRSQKRCILGNKKNLLKIIYSILRILEYTRATYFIFLLIRYIFL